MRPVPDSYALADKPASRRTLEHFTGCLGIDYFDLAPVGAVQMDGVLEHGQRLRAMIREQRRAFQLLPVEGFIGTSPGEEEAVPLVNLSETEMKIDSIGSRLAACTAA